MTAVVPDGSGRALGAAGRLDRFLGHALGDRLVDGPAKRSDEPCVAGQRLVRLGVDLGHSGVDAFGQVIGQPEVDVLRHATDNITCTCNISYDSVPAMTNTILMTTADLVAERTAFDDRDTWPSTWAEIDRNAAVKRELAARSAKLAKAVAA